MLKKTLVAVLLLVAPAAHAFDGAYFQAVWEGDNYKHQPVSAGTLLSSRGGFDGLSARGGIAWHKADPANSLVPQFLRDAGVKPFSWTLLACGGAVGNGDASFSCGPGVNLSPTVLGPLAELLKQSRSSLAQGAAVLIEGTPDGTGLNLGPTWSATPVANGAFKPINRWGSKLDWFLGAAYTF